MEMVVIRCEAGYIESRWARVGRFRIALRIDGFTEYEYVFFGKLSGCCRDAGLGACQLFEAGGMPDTEGFLQGDYFTVAGLLFEDWILDVASEEDML
jgi:hypothetical protein